MILARKSQLYVHISLKHSNFTSEENVSGAKKKWVLAEVRAKWTASFMPPPQVHTLPPTTCTATGPGAKKRNFANNVQR